MGAILAIVALELNTTTIQEHQVSVNTTINDKPTPEEDLVEEMSDSDREIKQNEVIEDIQELENCANCCLKKRVEKLLEPWVNQTYP